MARHLHTLQGDYVFVVDCHGHPSHDLLYQHLRAKLQVGHQRIPILAVPVLRGLHRAAEAEESCGRQQQRSPDQEEYERLQEKGVDRIPEARHARADAVADARGGPREAQPACSSIVRRVPLHPNSGPDADQSFGDAHPQLGREHQQLHDSRHRLLLQLAEHQAARRLPEEPHHKQRLGVVPHQHATPDKGSRNLAELVHGAQHAQPHRGPPLFRQGARAELSRAAVIRHQSLYNLCVDDEDEEPLSRRHLLNMMDIASSCFPHLGS
mmetsp:Transcript_66970/g.173366  ORF Transcript_66970/g.173366 Transcript_66970/m.173366 type:complete len:267 (+) Transcript_66970:1329-2129(+)